MDKDLQFVLASAETIKSLDQQQREILNRIRPMLIGRRCTYNGHVFKITNVGKTPSGRVSLEGKRILRGSGKLGEKFFNCGILGLTEIGEIDE